MFAPTAFPNEIYDYIIDHLHKNRRALSTCSLVCKDWRTTSRFHLFSIVELHVQDVDRDLAILSSPLATVPAYVKHLSIDACTDVEPESGLFEKLVNGLPPMKQIKVLRLHEVDFQLSSSAKGNLFSLSRDIATLELINVNFPTSSEQTELISSAASLQTLFVSAITYGRHTSPKDGQRAPPLKTLQLFDTHSWHAKSPTTSSILNWLALDSQPKPSLSTLELRGITNHHISSICAYVHALGNTLENIVIECSEAAAQNALSQELDLTNFGSLKTIVFHAPTHELSRLGTKASTWMQRILSKVSSERIQKVSFMLDFHSPVDLAGFDISGVGKLFMGGISCLSASTTKIRFEVASRYVGVDELRKPIISHLPSLADRLEFGRGVQL
ncbi:hypothetical protein HYPSUDRAFT_208889 [Hypholoma sublateritium FD-334 SS-4]|uniref:F-box domain-containing protein n=1 Tax=Hypholoma sublateritium (strain FD-334 SS-4) TaxID=945553 RepID=A0A0D2N4Z5_HYPSF|nr:hypothetical protein HYPSUDRAFT_208889 [Hypholoma sublateritium FD-334 SS-4]